MKKVVSLLVLVILISSFSFAQNETVVEDSCSGVWGTISCFFWGNPDARPIAGQAWSDRGALVGEAKRYSVTYTDASGISQSTIVETTDPNSAKMGVINELSKDKACLNSKYCDVTSVTEQGKDINLLATISEKPATTGTGTTSVGEAKRYSVTYTDASGISQSTIVETTDPNSAKMGVINELSKDKACLNSEYCDVTSVTEQGSEVNLLETTPTKPAVPVSGATTPAPSGVRTTPSTPGAATPSKKPETPESTAPLTYTYTGKTNAAAIPIIKGSDGKFYLLLRDDNGKILNEEPEYENDKEFNAAKENLLDDEEPLHQEGKDITEVEILQNIQNLQLGPAVTPAEVTQRELSKKEILKQVGCFNNYNCRGEQLTNTEAYEKMKELATTAKKEAMTVWGSNAKKYYTDLRDLLSIEPGLSDEDYKTTVNEKVKDLDSNQLRLLGFNLEVQTEKLSQQEYANKISASLEKLDETNLKKVGDAFKIQKDKKSDEQYKKDISEAINKLDEEQLNTLGANLNVNRDKLTDEEYKAAVLKALENTEKGAEKELKEARDLEKSAEDLRWQGSFVEGIGKDAYNLLVQGKTSFGDIAGGVLSLTAKLGSYRSLSNLLVPDATKKWMETADSDGLRQWADLDGFLASEACRKDEEKRSTQDGKAYAFVRTTSGTYQFVGSIQAEKSESNTLLLCTPNPDQEAEDKFVCSKGLVCGEDQFCYEDKNNDLEPDNKEPVKGRFYKITWGVTAPQDEKYTPYVDENGKAVRFNLHLYGPEGDKWIFKRLGATGSSVLALENGQNDGGLIVKYLPEDYNRICIEFNPADSVKDFDGSSVSSICTSIIQSSKGKVQYEGASAPATVASGSGEVYMDI